MQVTSEIGDTWIYGVASDPKKVAEYRELLRWRRAALPRYGATALARFDQLFVKLPEHTWSVSVQHLSGDIGTYDNTALHARVSVAGVRVRCRACCQGGMMHHCLFVWSLQRCIPASSLRLLAPPCLVASQLAMSPLPDNINVTVHSWERQRSYMRWAMAALGA